VLIGADNDIIAGHGRVMAARKLGRQYIGVELRKEQVDANRQQADVIFSDATVFELPADNTPELTPVEQRGAYFFKRDDLFCVGGVQGGKVRSCFALSQGAKGLVTAGSRQSPQVNIVAHIAKKLGVPCRVHTPEGELSPEVERAKAAGAEIIQHKAGYNSVIIARAREDAQAHGWFEVPFGMECQEAVDATARQVANIPKDTKRIVMPVGSGMSLSGVLHGLKKAGLKIPVLGVVVGADPTERLEKYAPKGWRSMVTLVESGLDYHDHAPQTIIEGLALDPVYEAKAIKFLEDGDLFWVVGCRQTASGLAQKPAPMPAWHCGDSATIDKICHDVQADMVLGCPPYADLEVYSDDPRDISNKDYPEFLRLYREIIQKTCSLLKPDSFAAWVIGEVRDKRGNYYNFVGDTVQAFKDAGLSFYNEAILVTAVGSLPIRAGRQFSASRKLGKTHQNVLVFVKGDGKKAADRCGDCGDAVDLTSEDNGEEEQAAPLQ
jgi:1-aminocyclopropane-1-carboxylate deaminase/D-cysteine desulfhydrase-like pyridoxal-dependent ACC family enzyme